MTATLWFMVIETTMTTAVWDDNDGDEYGEDDSESNGNEDDYSGDGRGIGGRGEGDNHWSNLLAVEEVK
jgi:hypothetical protein